MRTARAVLSVHTAALAVAISGCALKTSPTPSELQQQALPHTAVPAAWKAARTDAQPVTGQWLATFNDPVLSALVDEATAYNTDLQVAAARVEQAAGYLRVASGSLLPSVGAVGLAGGKSGGGGGGLQGLFLNASPELDLWGRLRYAEAGAQAQSDAVAADFAYARQSLAAMVARSWLLAIEARLQVSIAKEAVRSSESLLNVTNDRLRVGNGNAQAVAQARAGLGSYRDGLQQAELAREQAARALELLLGRYPATEIQVAAQLPAMPAPAPVGLPSQLLERRPDVVAAERRVAAAFNRVGEAQAARLPRISLTAGGSNVSSDLFVLKDTSNPVWSFGANLIAPLYQGGALQAQVDIRSAEQKQAVADYARAGQRAFGEVEGALGAEASLRTRDAILQTAIIDNEEALRLAQTQYRVGSADLRAVEQNQLALYAARSTRLRVQTEQLTQRVNLYLALGGGFGPPAMEVVAKQ